MAAYATLLSVSQSIQYVLPHEQDYISFSTKDQLISLHANIIFLQQFLEAIPMKFTSKISPLESRLTGIAYQLEDLIESTTVKGGSLCESAVPCDGVTLVPTTVFNSCIEEVSAILQEAKKMKEIFKEQEKNMSAHDDSSSTPSSSVVVESSSNDAKVGLDDGLKQIVQRVKSREESLQIIPIVGMGGIGKTTLARAVYEDQDLVSHFDVCCWVTISQQYNIQDILLRLLGEEKSAGRTEHHLGLLIKRVYQKLFRKRFLIVLDDMWDGEAWNGVMTAMPNDSNCSRVILTTRLSDVARTVSSSSPQHQMSLLNKDQSWDLLRQKTTCPPEFEALGRQIAESCKGLPVRIVVVGGMLKSNMSKDYWEEVDSNINEAVAPGGDGQLDGVLSLSYDNLPPHLKSCFLYFGAYPEDEDIDAEELIWLWVAEGFARPEANKTLEEIAEEYLEDLVKRNLVLVWERSSYGKIERCSIHDILRELSLIKAKQDKFLQCFTDSDGMTFQNIIKSQRRVSVLSTDSYSFPDDDTCNTSARSLLFMEDNLADQEQLRILAARLKLLKVLYNVEVRRESMFSHIFELTNLRLLCCWIFISKGDNSNTTVVVPESISNLQKLQTLLVFDDEENDEDDDDDDDDDDEDEDDEDDEEDDEDDDEDDDEEDDEDDEDEDEVELIFPADIWKLHELRHIQIDTYMKCTLALPPTEPSEANPAVLQHLQTLGKITNLKLTESLIGRIPNLKELRMFFDDDNVTEYGLNNIVRLCQLEYLYLEVSSKIPSFYLPADFVFPNNLKRLEFWGHGIFSSWEQMSSMVGSLPNLEWLRLWNSVEGSTWEPEEGQFLQLKYLEMDDLKLKCWRADNTHFPCLEELVLDMMKDLEEIPLDIGYIPTMKKLSVLYCSEKVKKSAEEIREEQHGIANYLQVEIRVGRE